MRLTPFTRPTVLAAVELLELHTQARFDQMVLRLGLEASRPSLSRTDCSILGIARLLSARSDEGYCARGKTFEFQPQEQSQAPISAH